MLSFITRFFAVIGIIVTSILVIGGLIFAHMENTSPAEPDKVILVVDFDQPIVEKEQASPLDLAMHEEATPLLHVLHAIDVARGDPHVKGLAARFGSLQPPMAQAQEIRAAIERFRASGKFTYAFGSTFGDFGGGNRAYYLASAFENIWLQPVGSVSLTSVAMEEPFAQEGLAKLGVSADFVQREEYKSAMNVFTLNDFAPPVRANMQSLIDDLASQEVADIAQDHKWDVTKVAQLMATGPFTADEALKAGLITKIGYADEVDKEMKKLAGDDVQQVSVDDYIEYTSFGKHKKNDANPVHIALIYGDGLITDHDTGASNLAGDEVMAADSVAGAFDDAADDKDIKAIIFRINSPGGSPEASETIRRAMIHAQSVGKPVFVSMGDVAASGGYWVAMNADSIIAEPGTLTGSIGVVGGKFIIGGLMQKLGVNWDRVSTGPNAGMWSMTEDYTPAQKERVEAMIDDAYHAFTQNVATARKLPPEKIPDFAKGRVFTGAQAKNLGLVDELGGYDVALAVMRQKLNLRPEDPISIEMFPAPLTPAEKVMRLLKNVGLESLALQTTLGHWQYLQAVLEPFIKTSSATGTIKAQMPTDILHFVQ